MLIAPLIPSSAAGATPARRGGVRRVATDPVTFRRVLAAYPSGVVIVAAVVEDRPTGLAASSFTSVSLEPPLVSLCIAHTSTTWPLLQSVRRVGVSVLSADQENVARALSSKSVDRFAGLDWYTGPVGAVRIGGASAWLDCAIETVMRAGDHDIVLLRVLEFDGDPSVDPLVFHGSAYRKILG
jgi:flavin reductase (DIM6/NTAB) family NADH-FMN oxidoreductase RutF